MDFTSDIAEEGTHQRKVVSSSEGSHENSDASSSILGEEDRRRLELEALKEELLVQRDAQLQRVEQLRRELDRVDDEEDDSPLDGSESVSEDEGEERKLDDNAANVLVDLMLLSNSRDSNAMDTGESVVGPTHVDGTSSLQEELSLKFDTLPLLNMKLRIQYLEKFLYPQSKMRVTELAPNHLMVSVKFRHNLRRPFSIRFEMKYDGESERLDSLHMVYVSPHMRLLLQPLFSYGSDDNKNSGAVMASPTRLLFFCHEYDRISSLRYQLMEKIRDKFKNKLNYKEITLVEEEYMVHLRSYKQDQREITINFAIKTDLLNKYNNKLSILYPEMRISINLLHNGIEVTNPDVNEIYMELASEYGVERALIELISHVMFVQ